MGCAEVDVLRAEIIATASLLMQTVLHRRSVRRPDFAPILSRVSGQYQQYTVCGPQMIEAEPSTVSHGSIISHGVMEVLPRLPDLLASASKEELCVVRPASTHAMLLISTCRCVPRKSQGIQQFTLSVRLFGRGAEPLMIAKQLDLLLCLFPFEAELYAGSGLRCQFIGHPLANQIRIQSRSREFGRPGCGSCRYSASYPKSSEVKRLLPLF